MLGFFVKSTADFSPCRTWRYSLTRRWKSVGPLLPFTMLNPSTADEEANDPTVAKCCGYASLLGYSGVIITNVYALRSTDPSALRGHADPVGPSNIVTLRNLFAEATVTRTPIVCAWGGLGNIRGGSAIVRGLLRDAGVRAVCLGMTKYGEPLHPLYLKKNQALLEFKPE